MAGAPPAIDVDRLTRLLVHLVTGCPLDADPSEIVEAAAAMSPTPPPEIVEFVANGLADDNRPVDAERWRSRLTALPEWPPSGPVEQIDFVEITADLARNAGRLAQHYGLRGYDAVHLAAGLAIADPDVVFVTGDTDLADAAKASGLATAVPTPRST